VTENLLGFRFDEVKKSLLLLENVNIARIKEMQIDHRLK
jgi:hypothetical protein